LITNSYRVEYKYGDTIKILPISDVHLGSAHCDEKSFSKWLADNSDYYVIGLTGTFLKTYSDTTDPTYAEVKGYPPVEIGGLVLNLKPTSSGIDIWFDN
jgi:hypothetical protein